MENDKKRFARMLWKSRNDAGMSQEYMASALNVSRKTIQNWESGVTFPDFYQGSEWFCALGLNPMKYYYGYVFENMDDINGSIDDKQVDEALFNSLSVLTMEEKRRILFVLYGNHGSSPDAVLNLINAHLQLPIEDRIIHASSVVINYRVKKELGKLSSPNNIQPNIDIVDEAIRSCYDSAVKGNKGYTIG